MVMYMYIYKCGCVRYICVLMGVSMKTCTSGCVQYIHKSGRVNYIHTSGYVQYLLVPIVVLAILQQAHHLISLLTGPSVSIKHGRSPSGKRNGLHSLLVYLLYVYIKGHAP